jgi:hypothetical protein
MRKKGRLLGSDRYIIWFSILKLKIISELHPVWIEEVKKNFKEDLFNLRKMENIMEKIKSFPLRSVNELTFSI